MSNEATSSEDGDDVVAVLQSHVESLRHRVKELETQNANLLARISSCHCHKIEEKLGDFQLCNKNSVDSYGKTKAGESKDIKKEVIERVPGFNTGTIGNHFKRYVALKVMYFGRRFYGFSAEAQMEPSIESEIFKAMEETRLLVGDKKESQYSRCGRTDRGVSSVGQVIALLLRSKLKAASGNEVITGDQIAGELDYVRVLNRALPDDIRIMGWCPVPLDFSARFSCFSREYKYFFWRENMNLLAMESACKKFVGEHDFRNFCKMDATNVHTYMRRVTSFEVFSYHKSYEGSQLCAIKIKGSAFLWHQVRCMVAVLFMIGQGLESADVIDELLDTKKITRKPQYIMAPEIPLILQSCEFEDLKFTCSSDQISLNNGKVKKKATHVPLFLRPTERKYSRTVIIVIEIAWLCII